MKKSLYLRAIFVAFLFLVYFTPSLFAQDTTDQPSEIEEASGTATENDTAENTGIDESTIILNPDVAADGEVPDQTGEQLNYSAIGVWDYLRMVLILAVIIGVIYLFFHILKKISNKNLVSNDLISIMGTQVIKGDAALHIIELGNNYYLVGSGSGNVSLIDKIEDKETLDRIKLTLAQRNAQPRTNFKDILLSKFNIPFGKQSVNDSLHSGLNTIKSSRENLNRFDPDYNDSDGGEE